MGGKASRHRTPLLAKFLVFEDWCLNKHSLSKSIYLFLFLGSCGGRHQPNGAVLRDGI